MNDIPFIKRNTFSDKLLDYYEYECSYDHNKFLYFCLILWIINYHYSDNFINNIIRISQFRNKSHIYNILKNRCFSFRKRFVLQKKSQVNQLFLMMIDLKVRISYNIISEIKGYIINFKIREYLDKLYFGYQDTIKTHMLDKLIQFSHEKKLKWLLDEKERKPIKKAIKKPLIPVYYASSENTWIDNRPNGSIRNPIIKSIPFGGQNKKY